MTGPLLTWVGEGGEPEVVAPRSDYERLFKQGSEGHGHTLVMDGRRVGEAVMQHIPSQVRRRGIKL